MNSVPPNSLSATILRQRCQGLLEQAARLAESDLEPSRFHAQLLQYAVAGTGATSAALWLRSTAGLQLDAHFGLGQLGLDADESRRGQHDALLLHVLQNPVPLAVPPHQGPTAETVNPTELHLLLVPILVDEKPTGVLQVGTSAAASNVFGSFLVGLTQCAARFHCHQQRKAMLTQRGLWERLEAFQRQVHVSLELREVALIVANQGRQLIECDRLSVLRKRGRAAKVEAMSGVETIDSRARQVRLLGELSTAVLTWGEPLVYRGEADDSLPPDVLRALDAYLADSGSKLLAVLPLCEAEEAAHFALVLECFEPGAEPEPLLDRLMVIGRNVRAALENAAVYHRVPLRRLWRALPEWSGSKGTWMLWTAVIALSMLVALAGVPYPMKVEATGQLLPHERRWVYPPGEGQVIQFEEGARPGSTVVEGQALARLHNPQLEAQLTQLDSDITAAQADIATLSAQQNSATTEADRAAAAAARKQKELVRDRKLAELKTVRQRLHADETRPGDFWLVAPMKGTLLTWDFRERWTNRFARPTEPLLRLGDRESGWEIELKIPYQQLAPILEAFAAGDASTELDVDLLLLSTPTRTFKGKLARAKLAAEASADMDSPESPPVVRASVRIDGPGIAEGERVPRELLVSGTEVHGKVRCGPRRLGQVLFHGAWEFLYEHVLFQ